MPNDEESIGSAPPAAVVALCASAASTGSLKYVLARLPPQPDAAVVVVLQHREALDEEGLGRALAEAGREAVPILDGAPVEAGKIYLPAPGAVVTVEDNRFRARAAEQAPGGRGVIDSLLVSLARDEDGRCIAVMLAGTDGDGTLGVKAIKEESGLALAEETEESAAGTLATSSSPAAGADAVLPVAELALHLAALIGQVARAKGRAPDMPEAKAALASIAAVLRNRTGHDFHGYKPGTFLRRVQRRMQVSQIEDVQRYVELLRAKPEEAQNLFNDLLIGVTSFFRDPREFEVLERAVVPKLFENKTGNDPLRVWVAGCSTGEEAYSIAILLRERMARLDEMPHVQIFATDLDGRALAAARTGRYADAVAKTMTPERLARWFSKEGDTYCVARELREMCIFSQHSIIKDPPFSRLDLVSCRNLLIYLDPALQARVIPLFHFALNPGGFVFLGSSENASRHAGLFAPVEPRSRIFRRLDTAARVVLDLPFAPVGRRLTGSSSGAEPSWDRPRAAAGGLARRAERFAERFAPAYVLVDDAHNAVQFFGRTGRYIDPAGGVASLNILQLVHPDLRFDLRAALDRAAEEGRTVQVENLRMGLNGSRLSVDLMVEPIRADDATSFVVLFRDGTSVPDADDGGAPPSAAAQGEHARRLEAELRVTRDRLQATIEELESTNEELKSSNEEYQSLNEELQSANEEMETSREELQSVNEELTTVNGELAHRVQELGRANSDLKNLLESTQIATVFLDNDLRVTNFTPAAAAVFHLVEADVGRPIGHIKPRIAYEELQDDARRVLRNLNVVEREIGTPEAGAIHMVRVLPYRSTDNVIAGVVLTFMDVTARRRAEERLRESEARFRALATAAGNHSVYRMSPDWRLMQQLDGRGFLADTPGPVEDWPGKYILSEDRPAVFAAIGNAVRDRAVFELEHRVRRADGGISWISSRAVPILGPEGEIVEWFGAASDVTERRVAQERLRDSEMRFRGFAENSADVLWIADAHGSRLEYLSPAFQRTFGEGRDRTMADLSRWRELVHPEDREAVSGVMSRAVAGETVIVQYRVVRPADRRVVHLRDTGFPIQGEDGVITNVAGIVQDVTDLERAAARLEAEKERFRTLAEGIPQLVWRSGDDGLWTWASPQWLAFTGQSQEQSRGRGWLDAIHPDDHEATVRAWEKARPHGRLDVEHRVRRAADGAWRWHAARSVPMRDAPGPDRAEGRVLEWLGTMTDIEDLKRLQGQQQVLVAELQHRTRNLLAVVRNVARRSVGASAERDEYDARLATLGRVQGFLSRSPGYTVPLADLVGAELAATGEGADGKITVAGPAVELPGEGVQTVALALHELATNAIKYGALAQASGRLSVAWRVEGGDGAGPCLVIEWRESGVAMPDAGTPARRGYGSELITQALPYQLQAETALEFTHDGVWCRISLPAGTFRSGGEAQA